MTDPTFSILVEYQLTFQDGKIAKGSIKERGFYEGKGNDDDEVFVLAMIVEDAPQALSAVSVTYKVTAFHVETALREHAATVSGGRVQEANRKFNDPSQLVNIDALKKQDPNTKVREIAQLVRELELKTMSERDFAELLMASDEMWGGEFNEVKVSLSAGREVSTITFSLAMAWLDGKGYGDMTLRQVLNIMGV